ncbi:MAG: hypothetical protein K2P78_11965 [Gemmataceae bacterium]|nr:hypothetical protein [Gemmataceae bacterium]
MGTTPTQTPRRGGTLAAGAFAVSLLVVVAGCGGSGSDAPKDGKPGGAAAGGASARMMRQEFRDKMKTLPAAGLGWKNWDGQNREESENVGCPLLVGDLTAAFGEPTRKETRGKVINWDWRCKDGGVRVVASQEWSNKDLFGPDNKVKHHPGEFLAVLAVRDN